MTCGKSVEPSHLTIQTFGSLRGVSAPGRYLRFYRLWKHLTHALYVGSRNCRVKSAEFALPLCLIITVNEWFHSREFFFSPTSL